MVQRSRQASGRTLLQVFMTCLLACVVESAASRGATYLIEPDGSGDVPTIQAACIAASTGDTLQLANGVFSGDGNRDIDFLSKNLVLISRGSDPDSCVIDCADGTNRHRALMIYGVEGQVTINGITISNALHDDRGGAIYATNVHLLISNCRFEFCTTEYEGGAVYLGADGYATMTDCSFIDNRARSGAAIMVVSGDLVLRRCSFYSNRAQYQAGAIYLSNTRDSLLEECWFEGNRADWGGAIVGNVCQVVMRDCTFYENAASESGGAVYLSRAGAWGSYSRIRNCSFVNNRGPFGSCVHVVPGPLSMLSVERSLLVFGELGEAIYAPGSLVPALEYCDIFGNEGGDWTGAVADQLGRKGNIWADPLLCGPAEANLQVYDISVCLPANNEFQVQIGAHGQGCLSDGYVVYPDGSATLADIQTGVSAVPPGGVLELADGVFTGPGNRDIDFMGKEITIRSQSGDPATCVIDCEGSVAAQHRGFVWRSGEGPGATLQNVSVRNGYAPDHGGALFIENASPTLSNCRISHCLAIQFGGAVAVLGESAPVLTDCVLAHSSAIFGGGLYAGEGSTVNLSGCSLVANQASQGGGILSLGAVVTCENSLVVLGTGGGAAIGLLEGSIAFACSDLYGNVGGDWVDSLAEQLGVDGNRSADPCFCDPDNEVFTLCADSWCLPENNTDGCLDLIGALGVGCDACDCETGTATMLQYFLGEVRQEAGRSQVELSWQVNSPATPTEYSLHAQLAEEQWTVPFTSVGGSKFHGTDRDQRLQSAVQVEYTLYYLTERDPAWQEVAQAVVAIPDAAWGVTLLSACPNPFNPQTTIACRVGRPQHVRMTLHDLRGSCVATLIDGVVAAGYHEKKWDGTDAAGQAVAAGPYLVRLSSQDGTTTEKIVLLK